MTCERCGKTEDVEVFDEYMMALCPLCIHEKNNEAFKAEWEERNRSGWNRARGQTKNFYREGA